MPLACLSLPFRIYAYKRLPSRMIVTGFTISVLHSPWVLVNPNNPFCTALKTNIVHN